MKVFPPLPLTREFEDLNLSEHDMRSPGKELLVREFLILKGFRVGSVSVCSMVCLRRLSSPTSVQALSDKHILCVRQYCVTATCLLRCDRVAASAGKKANVSPWDPGPWRQSRDSRDSSCSGLGGAPFQTGLAKPVHRRSPSLRQLYFLFERQLSSLDFFLINVIF